MIAAGCLTSSGKVKLIIKHQPLTTTISIPAKSYPDHLYPDVPS